MTRKMAIPLSYPYKSSQLMALWWDLRAGCSLTPPSKPCMAIPPRDGLPVLPTGVCALCQGFWRSDSLAILHHGAPEAPRAPVPPFRCADQEQLLFIPEGEEKGGFVPGEALPLPELQQPQRHHTDSSAARLHTHILV